MNREVDAASPGLIRRLAQGSITAPIALALTDPRGAIEWVNAAMLRLTGLPATELIGRSRLDLLTGPVRETGEIARIRAAMEAGELLFTEFETLDAAGQPFWTTFNVSPGTEDGELAYFLIVQEDVTERHRDEAKVRATVERAEALADALHGERELLASVLSTIPHVVFWKDTEDRYLGCNDAYLRLRGLSGRNELVGRQEHGLPVDDDLGAVILRMEEQVVETGAAILDQAVGLPGPDGEHRSLLLSVLPRHTDGEAPDGVIGVGTDITRISELERQLAQATRLESIGQLAAGLAHEINTPVQYISDNVLFLADSFTDVLDVLKSGSALVHELDRGGQDAAEGLRAIVAGLDLDFLATEIPSALEQTLEGVGRVAEIIRAMKEFSHPGMGRVDTDLNRAVETTAQVSRNEWKYVAALHLRLDPDLGLVPCYEGELKQVVLNLIVNAAHAVAERREKTGDTALGSIEVRTLRDGDTIRISVSDDGTGMDEATRLRIFDPFFTTKEVGKGTGQGLAMARSCVVGKHGGSIDVASVLGEGSTFTLNLPATVDADEEAVAAPSLDGAG